MNDQLRRAFITKIFKLYLLYNLTVLYFIECMLPDRSKVSLFLRVLFDPF